MAWNNKVTKTPGRNKNNSNLDGVFKDFKKTFDDLLGHQAISSLLHHQKKAQVFLQLSVFAILLIWNIHRK